MIEEPLDARGHDVVPQAVGGGELQHVGWFRYHFADERWEWSPQVARMHGYTPGTVSPTTDLVLSHKHPDDYQFVAAALAEIRRTGGSFSTRHRIVDTSGQIHQVVVVGDQLYGPDGDVIGTHGFYVDVSDSTDARHEDQDNLVSEVKGMLMLVYRISAESASELLKWRSQETKVSLRHLTEQISKDFLELTYDDALPVRAVYDRLLLTAHLRIPE